LFRASHLQPANDLSTRKAKKQKKTIRHSSYLSVKEQAAAKMSMPKKNSPEWAAIQQERYTRKKE